MINLVSGLGRRQRQQRVRGAAYVLATSLRTSAAELEDLARRGPIEPDAIQDIIESIRQDAAYVEHSGGAA